jgi:hypothetical protein
MMPKDICRMLSSSILKKNGFCMILAHESIRFGKLDKARQTPTRLVQ